MRYIIITLSLIIILLNFKNKHNIKQVKNKNNKKQVKNKFIIGGFGALEISNMVILFIALTIIIYFTMMFFNVDIDLSVLVGICGASFVISLIAVLTGAYSYNIIKVLIFISIILSLFSSLLDVSASASYNTGCSFERFISFAPQIEENSINNTEQVQDIVDKGEDIKMSAEDIEQPDIKKTSVGHNFKYATDEWNEIQNNPQNWKQMCMNLHNRSHVAIKKNGILGRLNLHMYSRTSWIGWALNYFIASIIFMALLVNEKTNTLTRLNVKEPKKRKKA